MMMMCVKVLHRIDNEGIEGEKRYRYTPFFIFGARWGSAVNNMPRSLYPWERDSLPTVPECGWAAGLV
jgi:hypothetical protein